MANILLILAHPARGSFNHAIATTAAATLERNGHRVISHDLYAENFDPLLPGEEIPAEGLAAPVIRQHCEELAQADDLIIVHPNWWGQPPAILKGWVDRVFRPEVAYKFLEGDLGDGIPVGLLKAETALIFNTSNTYPEREREVFGDPLETLWQKCILSFCGIRQVLRKNFAVIVTSTFEERQNWLKEVENLVDQYFPRL
jgi:NAD(P)H dehydrogenase (quinone)